MRTHYDVLGVTPDTPDVVIKAAYRALAKEYHPDGNNEAPDSSERFIEIQAAYAVLSKPHTRSEYDAELQEVLGYPLTSGNGRPAGPLHALPGLEVPQDKLEIERIYARLALFSEPLAQTFYAAYSRGECGDEPARFAAELEKNFFREFFGEDPDTQSLARLLLLGGKTGAAFTLNRLMAAGTDLPDKTPQAVLPVLLEENLKDETLFAEWLKVKFGLDPPLPAIGEPAPEPAAREAATAAAAPGAGRQVSSSSAVRSLMLMLFWAVALYFVLFAALPLMK
jgi:curved DNA-binding protein CbpA